MIEKREDGEIPIEKTLEKEKNVVVEIYE